MNTDFIELNTIARNHHLNGNYNKAIQVGEKMLEISAVNNDSRQKVMALLVLGMSYRDSGLYEKANAEFLAPALSKCRTINNKLLLAECLMESGLYERYTRNLPGSIDLFIEALEICETIGDDHLHAECLLRKGHALRVHGRRDEAIKALNKAYELFDKISNARGIGRTTRQFAFLLPQEEGSKILPYLESSLKLAKANGDKIETARCYQAIAMEISGKKEIESVFEYLNKAAALYQYLDDTVGLQEVYCDMGLTCFEYSQYEEARSHFNKSLEKAEKISDYFAQADLSLYTGWTFFNEEKYDEALECFNNAAQLYLKPGKGKKADISQSALWIGRTESMLDHYDNALTYLQVARDGYEKINDRTNLAEALFQIALVHYYQDDAQQAQKYFLEALKLEKETGNKERQVEIMEKLAACYGEMGEAYHKKNDFENAVIHFQIAVDAYTEINNITGLIRSSELLGDVYLDLDDYKNAGSCYRKAATVAEVALEHLSQDFPEDELRETFARTAYWAAYCIWQHEHGFLSAIEWFKNAATAYCKLGNRQKEALCYQNIGEAYYKADLNYEDYIREALKYFDKARNLYTGHNTDEKEILADISEKMGYLYAKCKDYKKALIQFQLAQVAYENLKDKDGRDRVMDNISQLRKMMPF